MTDFSHSPLPMSRPEMKRRGWDEIDVLLVSGDAYVDHPSFGAAVIGRLLEKQGFRVGICAQPDWQNPESLRGMGVPRLFCGITAGNLDSMLANYTAARRKRREDAYSEGGLPGRRPNHATAVYAQLAKQAFPGLPVVLGGVEASLRRVAHYDYWQDKIRPSVLVSSKADLLVYGMGERAIAEVARRIAADGPAAQLGGIPGTAVLLGKKESEAEEVCADAVMLPGYEECRADPARLITLTKAVEAEQNPFCGRRQIQFHAGRALLVEPPPPPLSEAEMDEVYELPFSRQPHPSYKDRIPAYEMIQNSITVVRGCAGGCSFCGLGLHQGRFISSRSPDSVEREVRTLCRQPSFRGTITDLGGPTANLYAARNGRTDACRQCRRASCLFPAACKHFSVPEQEQLQLLEQIEALPEVKHLFISSGLRLDVAAINPAHTRRIIRRHVSGHLKVAPEHLHADVLQRMRKPDANLFHSFRKLFEDESRKAGKEQYLVPYFISNFPGCTQKEMAAVEQFLKKERWNPQQVQDFIPLPMTPAAAMYCAARDYRTGAPLEVKRGLAERRQQKQQLQPFSKGRRGGRPRGRHRKRH